jgi:O-antigen/teichoic acid export membrane protein
MQIYFGNAMLIAWSRGDIRAYRRYFATAMGLYTAILTVAIVLLVVLSGLYSWPALLGTRVLAAHAVLATSGLLAAATLILIPFGLLGAIYRAHGDYGRGTALAVIAEAVRGFSVVAVVWLGGTTVMAASVYLVVAILFWLAVLIDQRQRFGEFSLSIAIPTLSEAKETVVRSSLYLAPTIATPLVLNSPILLLGALGALPGAVILFSTSRTLTGFVRQVVLQFCHPIGAEMARQYAVRDFDKLRTLFVSAGQMVGGIGGLMGGFTIVAAAPFIRIWTHGAVAYDPWVVTAFVVTIVLTSPAQVALLFYQYNNKPGLMVAVLGSYAVAAVVFCLALIRGFSATGAAVGIGLAECLTTGWLMPVVAGREIGLSAWRYLLRSLSVAAAAFAVSFAIAFELARLLKTESLIDLIVLGAIWTALVAAPAFYLLLTVRERTWIVERIVPRLGQIETAVRRVFFGRAAR